MWNLRGVNTYADDCTEEHRTLYDFFVAFAGASFVWGAICYIV